jgi:hypothetical protein
MNPGQFRTSIDDSVILLKKLGMFKSRGVKNIGEHSDEFVKTSRKNKHIDIYNTAIRNLDYELLLFDDSIFQITMKNDQLRYAFIQNPNVFISREEYLSSIYSPEELINMSPGEFQALKNEVTDEEYEQYNSEKEINLKSHIIRYDMGGEGYLPLVHSYSHIHIGLNENLRISCSRILSPLKFVIFVIKNTYFNEWKSICLKTEEIGDEILRVKQNCETLSDEYWTLRDQYELYLH